MRRVVLEEQALDSFANVVFSLLLFWKETKAWPAKLTIISHEFKRARFMELHIPALRFPGRKVEFVGIDPGYMQPSHPTYDFKLSGDVREGEMERGYRAWEGDRLGCGEVLRGKRCARNCWRAGQGWFRDEEERRESGVGSERIDFVWVDEDDREMVIAEEVLGGGRQSWEE